MNTHEDTAYKPDRVSPPGETVLETAALLGLQDADIAKGLECSEEFVAAIASGDQAITPDIALKLENLLNVPARFWVSREAQYRTSRLRDGKRR
jgi:HTH-type transcriptional regulator / antitoxin HigA